MSDLVIQCRENGPYVIQLPLKVLDHAGNAFALPMGKDKIALCRCGHSGNKPFCDGSHKPAGFQASQQAQPAMPPV